MSFVELFTVSQEAFMKTLSTANNADFRILRTGIVKLAIIRGLVHFAREVKARGVPARGQALPRCVTEMPDPSRTGREDRLRSIVREAVASELEALSEMDVDHLRRNLQNPEMFV
jgi:hypothetical protein